MSYLLIRRFTIHWMILFLPALTVLLSWLRGLLIHTRATTIVNLGMAFNLVATAVLLFVGVQAKLPGIFTAALALNGAHCSCLKWILRPFRGTHVYIIKQDLSGL